MKVNSSSPQRGQFVIPIGLGEDVSNDNSFTSQLSQLICLVIRERSVAVSLCYSSLTVFLESSFGVAASVVAAEILPSVGVLIRSNTTS